MYVFSLVGSSFPFSILSFLGAFSCGSKSESPSSGLLRRDDRVPIGEPCNFGVLDFDLEGDGVSRAGEEGRVGERLEGGISSKDEAVKRGERGDGLGEMTGEGGDGGLCGFPVGPVEHIGKRGAKKKQKKGKWKGEK